MRKRRTESPLDREQNCVSLPTIRSKLEKFGWTGVPLQLLVAFCSNLESSCTSGWPLQKHKFLRSITASSKTSVVLSRSRQDNDTIIFPSSSYALEVAILKQGALESDRAISDPRLLVHVLVSYSTDHNNLKLSLCQSW